MCIGKLNERVDGLVDELKSTKKEINELKENTSNNGQSDDESSRLSTPPPSLDDTQIEAPA